MSVEEIPIRRLWRLRKEIDEAVELGLWGEVATLGKKILAEIKLAMNPSQCGIGKPSLDGVYCVGTMRYERAPEKTRKVLNKMNRILKTAKRNIPRVK